MDENGEVAEFDRYWYGHDTALEVAQEIAAATGTRQRVQLCTWPNRWGGFWYIAPTPAPAPQQRKVAEPCS